MQLKPDGTVPEKVIDGLTFHTYPLNVMDGAEFELRILLHLAPLVAGFEDFDLDTLPNFEDTDEEDLGKEIMKLLDPVTFIKAGLTGIDKAEFVKETMAIVRFALERCYIRGPNTPEAQIVNPDIHFRENKILLYTVTAYFVRSQLGPFGHVLRRLMASRVQDGSQKEEDENT